MKAYRGAVLGTGALAPVAIAAGRSRSVLSQSGPTS
jgi:hypothetical protein